MDKKQIADRISQLEAQKRACDETIESLKRNLKKLDESKEISHDTVARDLRDFMLRMTKNRFNGNKEFCFAIKQTQNPNNYIAGYSTFTQQNYEADESIKFLENCIKFIKENMNA